MDSNSVKLDFGLDRSGLSEESRKAWPLEFGLVYSVTLSKENLQAVLTVRNEGEESFEFQFLLHTYFKIQASLEWHSYTGKEIDLTFAGHLQGRSHRPFRR